MPPEQSKLDRLDLDLIQLMRAEPRAGVREYSRRLGVARGTVQSRLDKLVGSGVIESFAPTLNAAALGFPLSADVHLTMEQRSLDVAVSKLKDIPFIIYADSTAGAEDLTCRVTARDLQHLENITMMMMAIPGVQRVRTDIILRQHIAPRVDPLLDFLKKR
ncbi:Lrp/AsnC family transcriptional regulator [Corynebacterium anserum]|uniref:Winged helix-turn-helix transcriptional regulator n=1 Tax=Corynebacterium anserum TaxID=2684406 RepID=A0A7G7YNE2_9CORY|nr:Lrp/AsnC family transcriptional regulator [Corynebacterium anserum]MBC2681573.1 winged helix-turn-helix transcriptional regulator [Corynebacterium anserum]QNH96012.1 winged helix-turn-helix transcriptional regulator [Corynebacterium anserum]